MWAETIAFLASNRAKWLTRAEFCVDGSIIPVRDRRRAGSNRTERTWFRVPACCAGPGVRG